MSSEQRREGLWLVLWALLISLFLAALDSTIIATALPTIVGELGGLDHIAWVFTAYLLSSTVSVPLFGKISDIYGRRRVFQVTIVIFLAGSMLAGIARTMMQLILFRGIQGIGGGDLHNPRRHPVAARAPEIHGLLHRRVRRRERHRAVDWRLLRRQPDLALGLLRQHPDRPRRLAEIGRAHV